MTVAENIKRLRKERGFTQKQLAERCGMAESTLRQYEIGYRCPKIETLHRIAKALDKSIILLVEGCEDKYPLSEKDFQIDIENSMTDEEKELANLLHVFQNTIYNWETYRHEPKIETIKRIASALEVDYMQLIDTGNENQVEPVDIIKKHLLKNFDKLNSIGKDEAIKRVAELTEIPRYTKKETSLPPVNAAHADDYSNASDELKQQEEDIMNDENF